MNVPQNGWFLLGTIPQTWDGLWVALFEETSIWLRMDSYSIDTSDLSGDEHPKKTTSDFDVNRRGNGVLTSPHVQGRVPFHMFHAMSGYTGRMSMIAIVYNNSIRSNDDINSNIIYRHSYPHVILVTLLPMITSYPHSIYSII